VALKVCDQHYIVHQEFTGLSVNTRRSLMEPALQNVMKIRQEEAEFFHAGGRADKMELTSTCNFACAHLKWRLHGTENTVEE